MANVTIRGEGSPRRPAPPVLLARPGVEQLEDRSVPATLISQVPGTNVAAPPSGVDDSVTILGTSENGDLILFESAATNMVPGQISPPGQTNLFLYSQTKKTTQLISAFPPGKGNTPPGFVKSLGVDPSIPGKQLNAVISEDGSKVAFISSANAYQFDPTLPNGLASDGGGADVFVWDKLTSTVTLASRTSKGQALGQYGQVSNPSLSADGSVVSFVSTAALADIFPQTVIIPRGTGVGNPVAGTVNEQFIGGKSIVNPDDYAFRDDAANGPDLFRAVVGQTPEPVSYSKVEMVFLVWQKVTGGVVLQPETHYRYFMDGDIRVDALNRYATLGLAGFVGIRTSLNDVFRYSYTPGHVAQMIAGTPAVDTKFLDSPGQPAYTAVDGTAPGPAGNGKAENAIMARVSGDVFFTYQVIKAGAGDLVKGYVPDPGNTTGYELYRVKLASGVPGGRVVDLMTAAFGTTNVGANKDLDLDPRAYNVTGDGTKLVFTSGATNLVAPQYIDANAAFDIFQRDNIRGESKPISVTTADPNRTGDGESRFPTMTPDSLVVGFESTSKNLTSNTDTNNATDAFVRDLILNDTLMASVSQDKITAGNGASFGVFVVRTAQVDTSFYRRFLAFFSSNATNLDPNNPTIPPGKTQVYAEQFPIFVSKLARTISISGGMNGFVGFARIDSNGTIVTQNKFQPFAKYTGELRVATADVNGDGVEDIIVGAGTGGGPRVAVIDGFNGRTLMDFFAYEAAFTGGVYVAGADLNGDGKAEIIVGAGEGGGPRVRVFDGATRTVRLDKFAYEPDARTGVRVSAGDFNGDGVNDLVVSAGIGGGPRVRVFDGKALPNLVTLADFFALEFTQRGGVYVSAGDFDGDGKADLAVGAGPEGGPRVRVFSAANVVLQDPNQRISLLDFFAFDPNSRDGVRVAIRNIDGDRNGDIVAATGDGFPRIRTFSTGASSPPLPGEPMPATAPQLLQEMVPFDEVFGTFGAWVG